METFSVSFTLGKAGAAHGANVAHNNRKYLADMYSRNWSDAAFLTGRRRTVSRHRLAT